MTAPSLIDRTGSPESRRRAAADGAPGALLIGRAVIGAARLPFSVPGAAIDAGRSVWGWTARSVRLGVELPGRVEALLDEAVRLVAVIGVLLGDVHRIVGEVDDVIGQVRETRAGAEEVSCSAGATARRVDELIALYEPMARDAAPLAQRVVDGLSPSQVDAVIALADQLPALTESVQSDLMPILSTLDRVAPDLRELLDVAKDVRKAIDGVPGSGFFRRRGEAVDDERQDGKPEPSGAE